MKIRSLIQHLCLSGITRIPCNKPEVETDNDAGNDHPINHKELNPKFLALLAGLDDKPVKKH